MTNDGDIVNKILRSKNNHEKEYVVSVNKKITPEFIEKMGNGVPVLDTITKKCLVKKLDDFTFNIILTQGLNRQIRRMCDYLGYEVKSLKRLRIMNITLNNLKPGKYRHFTKAELEEVLRLVETSGKTMEASE
jgi:23S rRNA pseudouridine2604 synthase